MDNNAYNNAGQPILSKVVSSKKSFLFKSAIGIAIILMDIIIIGVAAGNLNSTRYAFASSYYYYYSPFWTFIFIIPPVSPLEFLRPNLLFYSYKNATGEKTRRP